MANGGHGHPAASGAPAGGASGSSAATGLSGDNEIDALVWSLDARWGEQGYAGVGATVTYSFADEPDPGLRGEHGTYDFHAFDDAQKQHMRQALEEWASAANIRFVEKTDGGGDLLFLYGDVGRANTGGFADFPGWGDAYVVIDTQYAFAAPGSEAYEIYLHEVGHALGFKHPWETGSAGEWVALPPDKDNTDFTVMSYTTVAKNGVVTHADELGPVDEKAAQYLYGVAGGATNTTLGNLEYLGDGADTFAGTAKPNFVHGNDGDDTLRMGGGNDMADGGAGDDSIDGGTGHDLLFGGAGNDSIDGGGGYDMLSGGAGADVLSGAGGVDALHGGAGADALHGGAGPDELRGGAGNDTLSGGSENDALYGGSGNDALYGGDGADTFHVEDTAEARDFDADDNDVIVYWGTDAADALTGSAGADTMHGNDGADTLSGGAGNDALYGGAGARTRSTAAPAPTPSMSRAPRRRRTRRAPAMSWSSGAARTATR